jgi:hypothetical protein
VGHNLHEHVRVPPGVCHRLRVEVTKRVDLDPLPVKGFSVATERPQLR